MVSTLSLIWVHLLEKELQVHELCLQDALNVFLYFLTGGTPMRSTKVRGVWGGGENFYLTTPGEFLALHHMTAEFSFLYHCTQDR